MHILQDHLRQLGYYTWQCPPYAGDHHPLYVKKNTTRGADSRVAIHQKESMLILGYYYSACDGYLDDELRQDTKIDLSDPLSIPFVEIAISKFLEST